MLIPALPAGATLGLIAPAGPPKPETLPLVPALLARHGYRARLLPGAAGPVAALNYLAADDATRLADLHAAYVDPGIDAVLCLRGGYGCARLLDRIDTALLRANPKLLIGFSDISSLIGLLDHLGLPSLHAPMPSSNLLDPGSEDDARALFELLRRGVAPGDEIAPLAPAAPPHPLSRPGIARGRLIGGNLAVFTALLGTPWAPRGVEQAILFLEDVDEPAYRVDRLLAQARHAGLLQAAAGFLIGGFTGHADDPSDVLADYLHPLGKPVLAGWPSGHQRPNVPLPMGLPLEMQVAARRLRLLATPRSS